MGVRVRLGTSFAAAFVIGIFAYAAGDAAQSNSWFPVGDLNIARANAASVLLDDGRVLITGGRTADGSLRSAELFTPVAGFSAAGEMLSERSGHAAVRLLDGRVLVTGGVAADGMAVNSAEIYDPSTNDWHAVPASMSEARAGHTATLLDDGRVLIAGGEVAGVPSSTFEVYDPNLDEFRVAGVLSAPRMQHAAAHLADGRVLIAGGTDGNVPLASA
jgi:N-acetylneuraminic acid mutarotase